MEPTIEAAVRAMLTSLSAVSNLVGERIRPDLLDRDDEIPAIILAVEEEQLHNDLDGLGGLVLATVRIEAIANTRLGSRELEQAIRTNLTEPGTGMQGYRGLVGQFEVKGCTLARRRPYVIEQQTDNDLDWYGIACFYEMEFQEIT